MDVMSVLPLCLACGVVGNGIGYWIGRKDREQIGAAQSDLVDRAQDHAAQARRERNEAVANTRILSDCLDTLAARDRTITDLRAALETAEGERDETLECAESLRSDVSAELRKTYAERDEALQRIGDVMADSDVTLAALEKERDALRDELARWKRPRDAKGHFVASEAGPAMSERL